MKEEDFAALDEEFIQRLWFEELYQNPLRTMDGREIQVLQPGFWNRGAGPDFHHAAILNSKGVLETGAVEIHLEPLAWKQHGHDGDPHYNRVILHVVWNAGPRDFFAGTHEHHSVPQVELSSQLRFPLYELRQQFQTTPEERKAGARIGRCRDHLALLPDSSVADILNEAGRCRFEQKCRLLQMRCQALGAEQALWIGLAEAMGFSRNSVAFHGLAQRLPILELSRFRDDMEREARLFGLAGLLPRRRLPFDGPAAAYTKQLWDIWWKERARAEEMIVPRQVWNLRGLRPLNRPERRIAVLSLLSSRENWKSFLALAREGEPGRLREFFESLRHLFWNRHYTFEGRASAVEIRLLGDGRLSGLMFNTVWPFAAGAGRDAGVFLDRARATFDSGPGLAAELRLLGGHRSGGCAGSILAQEGLIQIYRDFCLKDTTQCRDCRFPDLVDEMRS